MGKSYQLGTTGSRGLTPKILRTIPQRALCDHDGQFGGAPKTGITANVVSPGLILTPEVKKGYEDREKRKGGSRAWESIENEIAKNIPIGRIVEREEVAVAFIQSHRMLLPAKI